MKYIQVDYNKLISKFDIPIEVGLLLARVNLRIDTMFSWTLT